MDYRSYIIIIFYFQMLNLRIKKASWPSNVTYNDYKVVWLFHWKGTFPEDTAVTLDYENYIWISEMKKKKKNQALHWT